MYCKGYPFLPKVWLLQQKSCCEASRCGMYFPSFLVLACSPCCPLPVIPLLHSRSGDTAGVHPCNNVPHCSLDTLGCLMHSPREREVERHRALSVRVSPSLFFSIQQHKALIHLRVFSSMADSVFEDVKFNHRSQQRLMTEWICNVCSIIFHLEKIYYYLIRSPFWYKQDRVKMNVSIF